MFRYAEVEAALAKIHDASPAALGAFKGRIIHLQRIGIAPASPGRGKKIGYTFQSVALWAFCLQLSEFGIDPTAIKRIVNASPEVMLTLGEEADGEDRIYVLTPNFMSAALAPGTVSATIESKIVPLSKATFTGMLNQQSLGPDESRMRVIAINLSKLRRELKRALPADTK